MNWLCGLPLALVFISPISTALGQALMAKDLTIGASIATGVRSNALSRGTAVGGEVAYALSDRIFVSGSGGRFSGTHDNTRLAAHSQHEHYWAEGTVGVQFRLQHSISPYVDGGMAGFWGSGTEVSETIDAPITDGLTFSRAALRVGGGVRYVSTPASHWGTGVFYRIYFPVAGSESKLHPLLVLRSDKVFDRVGVSFFVRF